MKYLKTKTMKKLPHQYKTWLAFYRDVERRFTEKGHDTSKEGHVFLKELTDEGWVEKDFSITEIKAKAFDEVIAKLPTKEQMYRIKEIVFLHQYPRGETYQAVDMLGELVNP